MLVTASMVSEVRERNRLHAVDPSNALAANRGKRLLALASPAVRRTEPNCSASQ